MGGKVLTDVLGGYREADTEARMIHMMMGYH